MNRTLFGFSVSTAALLAATGCATAATARSNAALAAERGAPAQLVNTLQRGGRLTLVDIEKFAKLKMPEAVIPASLRESGATYELTTAQIDQLRASGVSDHIIDYLLSTPMQVTRIIRQSKLWRGYRYSRSGFGHFNNFGPSFRHRGINHRGGHRR